MKLKKLLALVLALCTVLCLFSACGKTPAPTPGTEPPGTAQTPGTETPENPQTPANPQTPGTTPTTGLQPEIPGLELPSELPDFITTNIRNPLTGLPAVVDNSDMRPYAVMLNNLTVALPQYGVASADIIYEVLAEGGITRMMALFQDVSTVGSIGTIRSARPYYIELAQGHDAVYIHAGGSPDAYAMIDRGAIASVDGTKGGISNQVFYRDQGRIASAGYEHSMFTTGKRLTDHVGTASSIRHEHYDGYKYTQGFVPDGTPENGKDAPLIRAFFTPTKKTSFEYDAARKQYGVYEYGATYVDGATGSQVFVPNVLCLFTDVAMIPGDSAGRLTVRTTGEGTGYFACGGKYEEIKWSRKDTSDPFTYTRLDGTTLSLQAGTSYVCILPTTAEVTFTEN